jgi:hypothetical protein
VREDPDRDGLLYAGTEFGLYVSFDDGAHWQPLQLDLPVTPVTDLLLHRQDLVVATQGRSFWILDDVTPLHQMTTEVQAASAWLFAPRTAYRMQMPGGFGLRYGWQAVPENPKPGVSLFYELRDVPEGEVTLEILDSKGSVIRTYSSEKEESSGPPTFGGPPSGDTKLTKNQGLNRFVWDFTYPGAKPPAGVQTAFAGNPRRGPQAPPGSYQARLKTGDVQMTQPFTVAADPRLETTQAEWEEQWSFGLQVRDRISDIYHAIETVRSVREQAKAAASRLEDQALTDVVEQLSEKLTAIEEKIVQSKSQSGQDNLNFPPKLDNQYVALYSEIVDSFYGPTDGTRERWNDLEREWGPIQGELQQILDTDVPAVNEAARRAGATAIVPPER